MRKLKVGLVTLAILSSHSWVYAEDDLDTALHKTDDYSTQAHSHAGLTRARKSKSFRKNTARARALHTHREQEIASEK